MKRLILTINNLGDNSASVECVDFNIWQGKRLLISDRINGKWSGEFAKVYNIDYDQEHPEQLRLESNAPLGVGISLSIEPDNDNETKPEPTLSFLAQEIEALKSTVAHQNVQILGLQNLTGKW